MSNNYFHDHTLEVTFHYIYESLNIIHYLDLTTCGLSCNMYYIKLHVIYNMYFVIKNNIEKKNKIYAINTGFN